jgi:hypothetical protein
LAWFLNLAWFDLVFPFWVVFEFFDFKLIKLKSNLLVF